jgi:hypothetical protein
VLFLLSSFSSRTYCDVDKESNQALGKERALPPVKIKFRMQVEVLLFSSDIIWVMQSRDMRYEI